VLRDIDLLKRINDAAILPPDLDQKLAARVFITFSFSTTDDELAFRLEPGAPAPTERLDAMKTLAEQGFQTGASLMPLLPFVTDTSEALDEIYAKLCEAGARYAFPAGLTLFGNEPADSKTLMLRFIKKYYPAHLHQYEAFFSKDSGLPAGYQRQFQERVRTVQEKYGLKNSLY
jgi:DNA repair photolyase